MQEEICLHFVAFNFLSCYHLDNKFYEWSSTQAVFQYGIQLCELIRSNPKKSPVMELLQWNGSAQDRNHQTDSVLVQILKSTPLIFDNIQQESAILHEITIVTWSCEVIESIGLSFTKVLKLRRLDHRRIFVVLSKAYDDDWIHCFKNGHYGSLLSKEKLEMIMKNSDYLEKALDDMLGWGAVVRPGTTKQKVFANCMLMNKADKLKLYVYDEIQISFATIEESSANCTITDPRLISTQDLKLVMKTNNEQDNSEDY
jgi:hypothetical protein